MRICCIIASLRLGGAERQLAGLACMLKAAGEDVEVLTYRDGDFYETVLDAGGVRHCFIPQRAGEAGLVRDIADHLKETGCETLISFLAGTNIKACLVKRLCPWLRLIVSERNCNTSFLPHDLLRFALYRRYADQVVCNSYAQSDFIRRHAPALRGRLYTIPNFTDLEYFKSEERVFSQPYRVVTTARLDRRKNALGLIRAAAKCPGLSFDWYGAGEESGYGRRCRRLIARLGISDRFRIHPSTHDLLPVYSSADAFCLPSFYEGTPNALAEALSCGLPSVCSDVSDNCHYVVGGKNGFLFNVRKQKELVRALRDLAATPPEKMQEYASRSRQKAERAFSKKLFFDRFMDLLRGPAGGTKYVVENIHKN